MGEEIVDACVCLDCLCLWAECGLLEGDDKHSMPILLLSPRHDSILLKPCLLICLSSALQIERCGGVIRGGARRRDRPQCLHFMGCDQHRRGRAGWVNEFQMSRMRAYMYFCTMREGGVAIGGVYEVRKNNYLFWPVSSAFRYSFTLMYIACQSIE